MPERRTYMDRLRTARDRLGGICVVTDVTLSPPLAAHPGVRELLDASGIRVHVDHSLPRNAWHEGKPAVEQAIDRFQKLVEGYLAEDFR